MEACAMKVEILITFTGFPDDTEASQTIFQAGSVVEASDAFGALIVGKGLAREVSVEPAAKKVTNKGEVN
jgi:hypothetical protein